ncbi:MAG: hypothetical protein KH436_02105 [Firmicutes bacterium]|nr:hypothetical protein [Bacillota bacterium]
MNDLIARMEAGKSEFYTLAFWSWNGKLEKPRLLSQIEKMKEVDMGGFIIHARSGLTTPYLSEAWMDAVEFCVEEGSKRGMKIWLYDDQGWPSGFVGGKLLSDPAFLARYLTCEKSREPRACDYRYRVESDRFVRAERYEPGYEYVCITVRTSPSNVDILNESVVEAFIRETHEAYYARLRRCWGKIEGFFTDEPQYFRYATPYSPVLDALYAEKYGESLADGLPYLFYDGTGAELFRYRYYSLLNEQYTENYAARIHRWCRAHGCLLTGHTIEESRLYTQMWCCAGAMPFYDNEDIPCVDSLCRAVDEELTVKQAGSVAAQTGKNRVLTESFACSGWDTSLAEFKWVAENQYVGGVNMMTEHLYQYSFAGLRKKDHPPAFSEHSPWYECFGAFNRYFGRLGYLLSDSAELCETVVIHPIKSAYMTYRREQDAESVRALDSGLLATAHALSDRQISHHFADETLMRRYACVRDGRLVIGACSYRTAVLPLTYTLASTTADLLRTFLAEGGRLIVDGAPPYAVDGERADLSFLKSNTTFDALCEEEHVRILSPEKNLRMTVRVSGGERFAFFTNASGREIETVLFLRGADNPAAFDLETGRAEALVPAGAGYRLTVPAKGSALIFFRTDALPPERSGKKEKIDFVRVGDTGNYLTLDRAAYSADGVTYGETLPIPWIQEKLLKERYRGKLFLKYPFTAEKIPPRLHLFFERMNAVRVTVNGRTVSWTAGTPLSDEFLNADLSALVKRGKNEIVFELDYRQPENAHYVLFDEQVTESLKNCLALDTELEEIYLYGPFGAYPAAPPVGVRGGVRTAEGPFRLSAPGNSGDAFADGYPFFAGRFRYRLKIPPQRRGDYELRLSGRFAAARVWLDGAPVPCKMDGSVRLHLTGNNRVETEIVSGNRNLYGPHHYIDEEPFAVAPNCFTMTGTWRDGKSPLYRDSYSFVPFGLTEVTLIERGRA